MAGPRCDYLHARLPATRWVHVLRLRSASAPGPSGHARTRSTNARPTAGVAVIWRAARSLWCSPAANSLPNFRRYEVIRAGSVVGSPRRIRSFASYVAASVGNGVDQPFVAQHTHCASRRGPGDLELFYQLTLGWYPRIRLVLARGDAPTKDVRDLPVQRNRSDRVNTVNAPICHIDNFSCMCLTSYVSSCVELASYVCRQADTGSYTLWSVGGVVRSLCSA